MHSSVQELFLFIDQGELVFQRLDFFKDSISNVMWIHLEGKTSQIAINLQGGCKNHSQVGRICWPIFYATLAQLFVQRMRTSLVGGATKFVDTSV